MHGLAKSGVLSQKVSVVMHAGTHADSPHHVMERDFEGNRTKYTHELAVDAYCGPAICLNVKVSAWELITDKHLGEACAFANFDPNERKDGIVLLLRTGTPLLYDDSKDYYHYSSEPGSVPVNGSRNTIRNVCPWIRRLWTIHSTPLWERMAPPR